MLIYICTVVQNCILRAGSFQWVSFYCGLRGCNPDKMDVFLWYQQNFYNSSPWKIMSAVTHCPSGSNQLHSSLALGNLREVAPAAACWWAECRPRERKGTANEKAGTRQHLMKEGAKRLRGEHGDRLHPLVPLSYWPKACPALAVNGDITVWNTAGEGGATAASCHPGNRSSPVHVPVSPLAISRSFIPSPCVLSRPLSLKTKTY